MHENSPLASGTLAQAALATSTAKFSERQAAWIRAHSEAQVSVWKVVGVERGKGLTLRDLNSDAEVTVDEVLGSALLLRERIEKDGTVTHE